MKKIGIYIHFPFCASKCNYCNFNSFSGKDNLQLKYFQSLIKEFELYSSDKFQVDTIFIGGGTPSIMFDGCISTILSEIRKNFKLDKNVEITIEANPNSVTKTKIQEWKESGVNRVSLGLQSTKPSTLKKLGRLHTKQDYINAVENIKSIGITNINTDCLIGLPGQKLADVRKMLGLVTKLDCTHVSVYSLILEEGTPLCNMVSNGSMKLPKEEKTLNMYYFANKFLSQKGFERYEVSNFAKTGYECKHNLHTWQMREYIGFGAGAHGYLNGRRYSNHDSIEDYVSVLDIKKKPIKADEKISKQEMFEETIMLGLRTKCGINLMDIKKEFGIDLLKEKGKLIENFKKLDFVEVENNILRVSNKGLSVLNKIILEIVSL